MMWGRVCPEACQLLRFHLIVICTPVHPWNGHPPFYAKISIDGPVNKK
jgi:hypothetical protein